MKPKHTPGPWRVDLNSKGLVRINDDPTCGILVGQAANARLVAAAPELLALLKKVLKQADIRGPLVRQIDEIIERVESC